MTFAWSSLSVMLSASSSPESGNSLRTQSGEGQKEGVRGDWSSSPCSFSAAAGFSSGPSEDICTCSDCFSGDHSVACRPLLVGVSRHDPLGIISCAVLNIGIFICLLSTDVGGVSPSLTKITASRGSLFLFSKLLFIVSTRALPLVSAPEAAASDNPGGDLQRWSTALCWPPHTDPSDLTTGHRCENRHCVPNLHP